MSEDTIYKVEERALMRSRSSVPALALIGVGAVLLVTSFAGISLIDYFWPAFIVIPGLLMLYPAYRSTYEHRSRLSFLAVPGAVFVAIGAVTFSLNLFDRFEAWAYAWPLLLAAGAAGLLYIYRFEPDRLVHDRGHQFIRVMLMLTLGLAAFFEIIVFGGFNPLVALALIALGIVMLLRDRRSAKAI
jgi:hypothetical protein